MVPRVPPTSGTIHPSKGGSLHEGLESARGGRPGRVRPRSHEGLQPTQPGRAGKLFDVSQMKREAGDDAVKNLPVHPGRTEPRYWRSLEELAGTPEFERF